MTGCTTSSAAAGHLPLGHLPLRHLLVRHLLVRLPARLLLVPPLLMLMQMLMLMHMTRSQPSQLLRW